MPTTNAPQPKAMMGRGEATGPLPERSLRYKSLDGFSVYQAKPLRIGTDGKASIELVPRPGDTLTLNGIKVAPSCRDAMPGECFYADEA